MPESLEVLRGRGAVQLAMAILQKAVDDYRDLCNREKDSRITRDEWGYSKKEIKEFFKSEYCESMLKLMKITDHGKHLLEILENE